MNEAETRAEHIDPALTAAGWGVIEGSRIRREYPITLGRIEGHGKRGKALTADRQRILLTLATGTGKTFIAFQIAWKLFHSRWNLSREATRRPRTLFLADRNILANQAFNAFSAFTSRLALKNSIRKNSARC